ncbi:PBP1A family penicillin-binding protein [Paenibacillus polysaccharolyticus]|uniref:transglycosylase domain-containing protein n=1 Tax=Paenibacillus polysaccharolyticus TaxID=582692 RepID=UPI00203A6D38|nr:penicillin-binding protein 1A [Paenibacillus polysaccharolyticus]MCM3133087.1 PBP1A family penicillin-binding protein [Paenibacillus polysaccharolyticus]
MPNDPLSRSNNRNTNNKSNQKAKPKTSKKKKITGKRVGWTLFFTMAVAIFCALGGYLFILISGERLLTANMDKTTINETSKVYDRNGNIMGELSIKKLEPVESDDIPKLVKEAFVATEDKRFYDHQGVDIWSIGRAAVKDVMARSMVEGGSTLTQQLAKNMFLSRDKTFFRKATEVSIAMALERKFSKDEILTMYLNRIFFGHQRYGIKAASEFYFGVTDLNKLKLWQIATLAAMPKGPSAYNPVSNPNDSKARRGVVLQLMYEQGYISKAEMDEAKEINYNYKRPEKDRKYQAFIDYVLREAEQVTGMTEDDLNIGGFKIYTTMDAQAQTAMESAFSDDSLFEASKDDQQVQGSMVIMNHENGGLVALLGGRDYQTKGYSRVTQSRRQPGSAFKPIVSYAPALETGQYSANSQLSNQKQCFGNYCPGNLHGYSSTISMTDAITKSENIPAVWLLDKIGVNTGVNFAKSVGIQLTDQDKNLAIALGGLSKGTNTLEMAQAYSSFANLGEYQQAYSIKEIKDSSGKTTYKHDKSETKRVMSEQNAYQLTQMLQNVVNDGTGRSARLDRPVAGKTGTVQSGIAGNSSNRDVWFVGYTPEWTAAVWMGYDNPDAKHMLKNSSKLSAAFFAKVMGDALKGVPVKEFKTPDGGQAPPPVEQPEQPALSVSGLNASYDPSAQTVSLSWTGTGDANTQYRVYRKETSEAQFTHLIDSVGTTNAQDLSALPGLTYEYYVTAYDAASGQETSPSNTVSLMIEAQEVDPQQPDPGTDPGTGTDPEVPDTDNPDNGGGDNGNPNGNNGNGNENGNNGNNGIGNNGNNGNGNNGGSGPGNGQPDGGGTPPGQGTTDPGSDGSSEGGVSTPGQVVTPDSGTSGDGGGTEAPSTPQSGSGG